MVFPPPSFFSEVPPSGLFNIVTGACGTTVAEMKCAYVCSTGSSISRIEYLFLMGTELFAVKPGRNQNPSHERAPGAFA